MFKTQEQVNSRLSSEKNLVNRFGNGRLPTPIPPAPALPQLEPILPQIETSVEILPVLISKPDNVLVTILEQPGNKRGLKKLSRLERNEIALRTRLGEGQSKLAEEYNVSQSAVSSIEKGKTKVDERTINDRLSAVQDVAMDKLLTSLGYITSSKMENLDAIKLSVIAGNLARVTGAFHQQDDGKAKVVVHIHAPEQKNVSAYKTVDV